MTKSSQSISHKRWKIGKIALFSLLGFIALERFCHKQTEGFALHKVVSNLSFHPAWEIPACSEKKLQKIERILSQPYFYLKSGGQCYTFLSQDERYVLKLFKHHHMRPDHPLARPHLPPLLDKYRLRLLGGKETPEERLHQLFNSFKLAYNELREETALIYIHLNKTSFLRKKLTITDKLGIAHTLDLDHLEFALQKKASLLFPTLLALIQTGQIEKAKEQIDSLVHLFLTRCTKSIADTDAILTRNFGFVEGKAIRIDLGNLVKDERVKERQVYQQEIIDKLSPLSDWLQAHSPELADHLEKKLSQL